MTPQSRVIIEFDDGGNINITNDNKSLKKIEFSLLVTSPGQNIHIVTPSFTISFDRGRVVSYSFFYAGEGIRQLEPKTAKELPEHTENWY